MEHINDDDQRFISMKMRLLWILVGLMTLTAVAAAVWSKLWWLFAIWLPVLVMGWRDATQSRHSLRRNFPFVGRGRWLMEFVRPFVRQYFFESETSGTPINRMFRSVVYQRAKGDRDTTPLGTKLDTYRVGYEWLAHSLAARHPHGEEETSPRVMIGEAACSHPYSASVLNVSAMSFGALSPNAVRALNGGARLGGFAHNTGEGGLSPYHQEEGGDLIWQIGTGYFGCRSAEGGFSADRFAENARREQVKMIEIKLSQGAKPGHGGILPAAKNTPEIAAIRGVTAGEDVLSPPTHSAFDGAESMMAYIVQLRELSGSKPVGIKLCVGQPAEIVALCRAMLKTGNWPDFITVDGGEGGTGAAPLEFSNSVGMPLREALALVDDCLRGFGLRDKVMIIAAGRMFTAYHITRNLALGADVCYSARAMMLALGCVQSLLCNTNECPTGIATQHKNLGDGLVVSDKRVRVARFHGETVQALAELVGATGLHTPSELTRAHVYRRVSQSAIATFAELFPPVKPSSFLSDQPPERYAQLLMTADTVDG